MKLLRLTNFKRKTSSNTHFPRNVIKNDTTQRQRNNSIAEKYRRDEALESYMAGKLSFSSLEKRFSEDEGELELRLWIPEIQKTVLSKKMDLLRLTDKEKAAVIIYDEVLSLKFSRLPPDSLGNTIELNIPKALGGKKLFKSAKDASTWLITEFQNGLTNWY